MTKQTRQEIARMACKAFAPRLVGSPCVYPDCACKGPDEIADYVLAGREALQGVVKAWDSLRMGDYPRDIIETWLIYKMMPAIEKARIETWLADKMKPAIEKARGVLAPPVAEPIVTEDVRLCGERTMNDDSHFLMSLGAEMESNGRPYYSQRCREIADEIVRRRETYPYSEVDMDMHVEAVTKDLKAEIERLKTIAVLFVKPGDIVEIEVPARSSTSPDGIRYRGRLVALGVNDEPEGAPSK